MIKIINSMVITVIMSVVIFTPSVKAGLILDVTYSNGRIVTGPLGFGLDTLPEQVKTTFKLEPIIISTPPYPGGPIPIPYPHISRDIDQVLSATMSFGNLTLVTSDLVAFDMNTDANGILDNLSYKFEIVGGGITLNFPLTITGIEEGEAFEYIYNESTYTLVDVPTPAGIDLFALSFALFVLIRSRQNVRLKNI